MMLTIKENSSSDIKSPLLNLLISGKAEPKDSGFSALLAKINLKESKEVPMLLQNGSQVTALSQKTALKGSEEATKSVKETLITALLKESEKLEDDVQLESVESKESSSSVLKKESTSQNSNLLELISDAKKYLKAKIETEAKAHDITVEKMPKTLKGLTTLAKEIGIKVEKITLDTIVKKSTFKVDTALQEAKISAKKGSVQSTQEYVATKTILPMSEIEAKANAKIDDALSRLLKEDVKSAKRVMSTTNTQTASEASKVTIEQSITQPLHVKKDEAVSTQESVAKESKTLQNDTVSKELKTLQNDSVANVATTVVNTAPVKEQKSNKEAVIAKEVKTPKAKEALNPLKSQSTTNEEIKPIQELKLSEPSKVVSQLLHGNREEKILQKEGEQNSSEIKREHTSNYHLNTLTTKEGELVLKVKEAKQFVQHFAQEIKEEIQNYKPPFTRLKMQLSPAKLGEVDVTLVQRGHNVHININSNTTAITTLMQHAQELKTQLQNSGVNGATMQFQSGGHQQGQGQQHARQEQLQHAYEQFNTSEEYDSVATALEIIVPRYV